MKNYFKRNVQNFLSKYRKDKIGSALEIIGYFLIFGVFSTIFLFSESPLLHYIPIVLSISLSIVTFALILRRGKIYLNYYVTSLIFFVVYAVILTLFTSRNFLNLRTIVNVYLLCLVLVQFMICTKKTSIVFALFLLSIILFSVAFFVLYFENIKNLDFYRLGEEFNNQNDVGSYYSTGIALTIYFIIDKKKHRFLLSLVCIIFLLFVIMTGSRSSILISFLTIIIGTYFVFPKNKKRYFILSLIVLVSFFYILINFPAFAQYKKRFDDLLKLLLNEGGDNSALTRLSMIKDGFYIWLKNILFGYGAYGFANYTNYGTYSHTTSVELLVNFGIIGPLLFYLPAFLTLFKKKENKHFVFRFIFIIANFVFASFFFVMYYSKVFLIAISLIVSSDFLDNEQRQNYITVSFSKNKPFIIFEWYNNKNMINTKKIIRTKFKM